MARSSSRLRLVLMLSLAGAVATPTLVAPHVAHARRTTDLGYRYDQVWTAAVRLVRVDYGFNVTERDQDLGFVMFDYIEAGRTFNGSIEVVRTSDALGRERVRVVVVIQGQPEYVERMVMDRLERKLRGDYGAPPRPEPTPAPAATTAPAAEGADASDGDSDAGEAGR